MVITLTAKNPQAPKNVVRFDYTQGEYLEIKLTETMIDHLELESLCLHKDSQEAKLQMQEDGGIRNSTFHQVVVGIPSICCSSSGPKPTVAAKLINGELCP